MSQRTQWPRSSHNLQLSGAREGLCPVCPACDGQLKNPDDVVVTNLNPTEDYKTSVLSGLNPNIIMECAGRALSWWAYQATQEIIYQEYLAKNLSEKYSALNLQMDKIIHDANSEISNLRSKISNLQVELDGVRRKNEDLTQAMREKTRKHLQTQEMFDKLKRRSMLGQVQNAASDAVDDTIQASVAANRYADRIGNPNQRPPPPPLFAPQQTSSQQYSGPTSIPHNVASQHRMDGNREANWTLFSSQEGMQPHQSDQELSTHRHRLGPSGQQPTPRGGIANFPPNGSSSSAQISQRRPSPRQPLGNINTNVGSGSPFAGYGMSAGLKVSNPAGISGTSAGRPLMRSRAAHRSASGFPPRRQAAFGPSPTPNMFSTASDFY
ncbi:Cyclin [Venustampulla echinocandica]|uniref:Cyclin n=1 Tax=Venustampulla echinocandica TaxID=2656787 RepID=A0A370T8M3_9HELO|nr:Cyclin [Venustampulla echinocandica]RDL29719.1 Cyclin [Venustampulla echinocandica]